VGVPNYVVKKTSLCVQERFISC